MQKKYSSDKIITNFLDQLRRSGLSVKTTKFYKSDLSHFTGWLILKIRSLGILADEFSQTIPFLKTSLTHEYKKFLWENNVSRKTINRRLSSLRNLARFLIATQILDFDLTDGLTNIPAFQTKKRPTFPLIEAFQKQLVAEKVSKNTLKNYVNDVRQFLFWIESKKLNHAQPV